MEAIRSLDQLIENLKSKPVKKLAVAYAQDPNTIEAIAMAVKENFIEALMIGNEDKIKEVAIQKDIDPSIFTIINVDGDKASAEKAVQMVRDGEADVLMKGLVSTDKYLKAVLDKEKGLLPPKTVMSHVTVLEVPEYSKLLFLTDVAVIPFPTLDQKVKMLNYTVDIARKFGIEKPKAAILAATEKANPKFNNTIDASILSKMAQRGQIKNVTVDGPLDVFLACDPESVEIKGVSTPINGEADILLFPNIEAGNIFYKGAMLFGKGELAGLLTGTTKPVIVTSRSESTKSKYYSIALGCLVAE